MALDLADRQAARVKAQNFVVKTVKMGLAFGDQLRLKAATPVARHGNLDRTFLGQKRLLTHSVTTVAAAAAGGVALFIAQMMGQFGAERTFDQGLL